MFLLAKVVECEGLDSERFNITGQIRTLIGLGQDMLLTSYMNDRQKGPQRPARLGRRTHIASLPRAIMSSRL